MDDYSEIQFVETRNAPITVQQTPGGRTYVARPGQNPARTLIAHPGQSFGSIGSMGSPHSIYAQPSGFGVGIGGGGGVFGRMTTGQVIDMVAQIFAALMPLPAAPAVTSIADTDSGNNILYQSAIAQYAKRDEQIRTLGNLVVKLVG